MWCMSVVILTAVIAAVAVSASAGEPVSTPVPSHAGEAYRHPFISRSRLESVEKSVRARVAAMSNLQKARALDMYHGSEFITNGTLDLVKAAAALADGVGIIHDLYAPTTDIVNALQELAVKHSSVGVPVLFLEECLHGVNQAEKTIFPNPLLLGASFRPELVTAIGAAIGLEARAYGIRQCLSPVLGAAREPRWGRVEELFSEDAHLISAMAYAYVTGMQATTTPGSSVGNMSVVAEPKHYAAHSIPESGLNTGPSHVGRRELEETFLPQFQSAVEFGGALGIMAAYSEIDGVPCAANKFTLTQKLRTEWGFQGFVLSDLGAVSMLEWTHQIVQWPYQAISAYLTAGGNSQFYDYTHAIWEESIVSGVANGSLSQTVLDDRVADMLRVKTLLGLFDDPYTPSEWVPQYVNTPEHQKLALDAARQGLVLLQNNGSTLPLNRATLPAVGIFGMCAFAQVTADYAGGGGNINNRNFVTLIQALYDFVDSDSGDGAVSPRIFPSWGSTALLDTDVEPIHRTYYTPSPGASVQGLTGEYYDNLWLDGEPALTRIDAELNFQFYHWNYNLSQSWTVPDAAFFSVRWTGIITPDVTCSDGTIALAFDNGAARLWLNGEQIIDSSNCTNGCTKTAPYSFVAGTEYSIRVDYWNKTSDSKIVVSWNLVGANGFTDAVSVAKEVLALGGVAIVAVGDNGESSGEGRDALNLDLPGKQPQLVEAIAATGIPTIVVLFSGRAPSIPFVTQQALSILEAYGTGQAGGTAIVEALFGLINPGGRLPLTYPKSVGQLPAFYNRKPSARYHGYVDGDRDPVFPFGHGLSYTTFSYSNLSIEPAVLSSRHVSRIDVSVDIQNNGTVTGDEVVQLYIRDDVSSVTTPILELRHFNRVTLRAGETQRVKLELRVPRDLQLFDQNERFVVENGNFTLWVGASSGDLRLNTTLVVDLPAPHRDANKHNYQTELRLEPSLL